MYTLKSLSTPRLSLSPRRTSSQVHLDEVKSKLQNHSKHKDLSEDELALKAKQLVSVIAIKGLLQPISSSTKQGRRKTSGHGLVLNLRILDSESDVTTASNVTYSGTLALEFGLSAISSVLLHWNTTNVVIPYQESQEASSSQLDDTYLVVSFSATSVSRLRERGVHRSMTYDLIPFIPTYMSTASILEKVAEVVVKYNKTYYYHQIMRNSQMFVKDTLSAIGLSSIDSIMDEFLAGSACETQSKHQSAKHFVSHEDLDSYVGSLEECGGIEHTCNYELKTLGFWYLKFHVEEANQSTAATHLWMCPRLSCKEGVVMAMQTTMDAKDKL